MLGKGFVYDVYNYDEDTVIKIPRTTRYKKEVEENSYNIHKKYLGMKVAESKFINHGNTYRVIQEKIDGFPVDLMTSTNSKVNKILELGENLQENENILFDIFGLEGMIKLFNYYFDGKALKALGDLCFPINAQILKYIYNFPPVLLQEMNQNTGNPFIAHNLLEEEEGNITLIDTDHRPLDPMHPLNLLGNWITQKALKDIKAQRKNNK